MAVGATEGALIAADCASPFEFCDFVLVVNFCFDNQLTRNDAPFVGASGVVAWWDGVQLATALSSSLVQLKAAVDGALIGGQAVASKDLPRSWSC